MVFPREEKGRERFSRGRKGKELEKGKEGEGGKDAWGREGKRERQNVGNVPFWKPAWVSPNLQKTPKNLRNNIVFSSNTSSVHILSNVPILPISPKSPLFFDKKANASENKNYFFQTSSG